jgi:hypothetical protein
MQLLGIILADSVMEGAMRGAIRGAIIGGVAGTLIYAFGQWRKKDSNDKNDRNPK